jgi:hypothetical protein
MLKGKLKNVSDTMTFETMFIHILWASVSCTALYVAHKSVEKYTTLKSLEAFALASEKVGAVIIDVLKENGGRLRNFQTHNGTQRKNHHPTCTQTEKDHLTCSNSIFDLCN